MKIEKNEKNKDFNYKIVFPKSFDQVGTFILSIYSITKKISNLYQVKKKIYKREKKEKY